MDLEEVYPNEQELDLVDCLKACIRQFNDSDSLSAITRSGKAQTQVPMVNMHEHRKLEQKVTALRSTMRERVKRHQSLKTLNNKLKS